jgi:pSer/pThr/pTyr-binding forkhead associated (FHA) protein
MTLKIEIIEGRHAGRQIELHHQLRIRRDPDSELVLDDPLASRRHATLTPRGTSAVVEDL